MTEDLSDGLDKILLRALLNKQAAELGIRAVGENLSRKYELLALFDQENGDQSGFNKYFLMAQRETRLDKNASKVIIPKNPRDN